MSAVRTRSPQAARGVLAAIDPEALARALRLKPGSAQARAALALARHQRRRWMRICARARKGQTGRKPLLALRGALARAFWLAVASGEATLYRDLWMIRARVEALLGAAPRLRGRPREPDPAIAIDLVVPLWRQYRDAPISAYRDGDFAQLVTAVFGFKDPGPGISRWLRAHR